MFAPEGYYSWGWLRESVRNWTWDIMATRFEEIKNDTTTNEIDEAIKSTFCIKGFASQKSFSFVHVTNDEEHKAITSCYYFFTALEAKIFSLFLRTFNPSVCSKQGTILQPNPSTCVNTNFGMRINIKWPMNRDDLYQGIDKTDWPEYDLYAFNYINYNSGIVSAEIIESNDDYAVVVNSTIGLFNGWALCWNKADIPKEASEIFEALGLPQSNHQLTKDTYLPHNTPQLIADLFQSFPNGKKKHTWQEIEDISGWSRRHIKRVLERHPEYRWPK